MSSRFYDPETGRFVSVDDVDVLDVEQGDLNQYNLYVYCLNDPVNHKDSKGMFAIAAMVISTVCGALIGAGLSALEGKSKWRRFEKGGINRFLLRGVDRRTGSVSFGA